MALLEGHGGVFIALHVNFDTAENDPYAVRMFWSAPGIGVDLLDLLVELNPVWKMSVCGSPQPSRTRALV